MKRIVIEPLVYCLKLENDKYYVGYGQNTLLNKTLKMFSRICKLLKNKSI